MRQKNIFNEVYGKRFKKTGDLSLKNDCNILIYKCKYRREVNFVEVSDQTTILIKNNKKTKKKKGQRRIEENIK